MTLYILISDVASMKICNDYNFLLLQSGNLLSWLINKKLQK